MTSNNNSIRISTTAPGTTLLDAITCNGSSSGVPDADLTGAVQRLISGKLSVIRGRAGAAPGPRPLTRVAPTRVTSPLLTRCVRLFC